MPGFHFISLAKKYWSMKSPHAWRSNGWGSEMKHSKTCCKTHLPDLDMFLILGLQPTCGMSMNVAQNCPLQNWTLKYETLGIPFRLPLAPWNLWKIIPFDTIGWDSNHVLLDKSPWSNPQEISPRLCSMGNCCRSSLSYRVNLSSERCPWIDIHLGSGALWMRWMSWDLGEGSTRILVPLQFIYGGVPIFVVPYRYFWVLPSQTNSQGPGLGWLTLPNADPLVVTGGKLNHWPTDDARVDPSPDGGTLIHVFLHPPKDWVEACCCSLQVARRDEGQRCRRQLHGCGVSMPTRVRFPKQATRWWMLQGCPASASISNPQAPSSNCNFTGEITRKKMRHMSQHSKYIPNVLQYIYI